MDVKYFVYYYEYSMVLLQGPEAKSQIVTRVSVDYANRGVGGAW